MRAAHRAAAAAADSRFRSRELLGAAEELRVTVFGGTPLVTRGAVEIFRHDWSLDSSDAIRDLGYTMTPLDRRHPPDASRRSETHGRAGAIVIARIGPRIPERARQWVHIGSGVFALLLRVLSPVAGGRAARRWRSLFNLAPAAAGRRPAAVSSG